MLALCADGLSGEAKTSIRRALKSMKAYLTPATESVRNDVIRGAAATLKENKHLIRESRPPRKESVEPRKPLPSWLDDPSAETSSLFTPSDYSSDNLASFAIRLR
jgi:hypothetical protein